MQTKKKRNKGIVSNCALENAGILFSFFFLSVELKFWFIYNIMCFPLASKITTLKVYEKNMWWIYLPISESKTTSKSRKMKSLCWKALTIRFVPRGHVRGEEIKLQCHIFCYWKDIRSRPWNVCFWWSPCYQLVQKPFWNDKLWPNKKLLKLSHSTALIYYWSCCREKKRKGMEKHLTLMFHPSNHLNRSLENRPRASSLTYYSSLL